MPADNVALVQRGTKNTEIKVNCLSTGQFFNHKSQVYMLVENDTPAADGSQTTVCVNITEGKKETIPGSSLVCMLEVTINFKHLTD